MRRIIRRYLSLLVPLIALLVGIESIVLVNRALNYYEDLAGKNYAIVIVSNSELNLATIKSAVPQANALITLESQSVIDDLSKKFGDSALENLKKSLPFFYSLKLNAFPTQAQIRDIESELKNFAEISRVESFSKAHNQTYRLLVLLRGCVIVLSSILLLLSLLLMMKQIEVWRFEHSERMEIMTYFGAPSSMKNRPLYRLATIDSLLATAIVIAATFFAANYAKITAITAMLGIEIFNLKNLIFDSLILLASAYIISMGAVFVVILFQKEP